MSRPGVLVVHNRYQERGGEDSVFEAEAALLEAHGHHVERLVFDNRELSSPLSLRRSLQLGVETVWSRSARRRLRDALATFGPDVAYFHNTFPQISPAAYAVGREAGAAVVQTLHNYRLICPAALLYREGRVCEDCVGQPVPIAALRHACYRGSRSQTGAAVAMLMAHRLRGTWRRDVDRYIAPSAFLKHKLVEGGLPAERIVVKPNFVAPDPGSKPGQGDYALFVGRLTETKGIACLLNAYALDKSLPPLQIGGRRRAGAAGRSRRGTGRPHHLLRPAGARGRHGRDGRGARPRLPLPLVRELPGNDRGGVRVRPAGRRLTHRCCERADSTTAAPASYSRRATRPT